jgi:hypothetical protein
MISKIPPSNGYRKKYIRGPNLQRTIQKITQNYQIHVKCNLKGGITIRPPQMGLQFQEIGPTKDQRLAS